MKKSLLETLQESCQLITKAYEKKNNLIRFCILQMDDFINSLGNNRKVDVVRETAQIYDDYKGNEEYIHIPDINQMLDNLRRYPVIGAINKVTGEIEGIATIKYHENTSEETTDPYYPKKGAKFFTISGVIVRQRKDMLHKGLGSNLYAASILGIHEYAKVYPDDNIELNAVIDCTNLPSLYALANGSREINSNGYLEENKRLDAILDGIYTVRDEENHLVEAPTYVLKISLIPTDENQKKDENTLFEYSTTRENPNHMQYEELLDTILETAKQNRQCKTTRMEDKGTGFVDYIHLENAEIYLENIKLDRNGTENIGKKRVPRGDVSTFVGPMPYLKNYIEEENERDD